MTRRAASSARPAPRLQPISFFSIGKSGSGALVASRKSGWGIRQSPKSGRERRFDAGEEEPRDDEPNPDDEPEQRHQIDRSELGEALLPELTEVRHHPDREEGQDEEDHAQNVGFPDRSCEFARRASRGSERKR